jgi:hypothetical protein
VLCQSCSMALFAKSATVSVAAQKAGGDYFHPIGRTNGTAMSWRSPLRDGKRTPRRSASSGRKPIR